MKSSSRNTVIKALKALLGEQWFIRTTEEFDGSKRGIWTSNESWSEVLDGGNIYIMSRFNNETCTHPKVNEILKQHGWFAEPYDGGTLMLYPNS